MNTKDFVNTSLFVPESLAFEAASVDDKSANYSWHRGGFGRGMPGGMPGRMPRGGFRPPMWRPGGYFRRGCFLPGLRAAGDFDGIIGSGGAGGAVVRLFI